MSKSSLGKKIGKKLLKFDDFLQTPVVKKRLKETIKLGPLPVAELSMNHPILTTKDLLMAGAGAAAGYGLSGTSKKDNKMSKSAGAISKLSQFLAESGVPKEMQKQANKGRLANAGLRRSLKVLGIGSAGGASLVGAHHVGQASGKQNQLKQDQDNFKTIVPKIFNAGRVMQARQDASRFKSYLDKNMTGFAGTSKDQQSYTNKHAATKVANAVVNGWENGQVSTSEIQALPETDLQKVAHVLLDRMNQGDNTAKVMWRALTSDS